MKNISKSSFETADITWELTPENGLLTIRGAGKMDDYNSGSTPEPAPWSGQKKQIFSVRICEGITRIGLNAFRDCINLREVILPASLRQIGGYAFRGCTSLTSVISLRRNWRYIYEAPATPEDDTLVFGVQSFHQVPWARETFGDFYTRRGNLWACFSTEEKLAIPEGIRILHSFSLSNLNLRQIQLPASLRTIEKLAFSNSHILRSVKLPDALQTVDPAAFHGLDTRSVIFPYSWKVCEPKMLYPRFSRGARPMESIPAYAVRSVEVPEYRGFKKVMLCRNTSILKKNGLVIPLAENPQLPVGDRILRRLYMHNVVLSVCWKNSELQYVHSFRWNKEEKQLDRKLLSPAINEIGELTFWEDPAQPWDRDSMLEEFPILDVRELYQRGGILRLPPEDGIREEWFCCKDDIAADGDEEKAGDTKASYSSFRRGPEIELLCQWIANHPKIAVDRLG